MITRKQISKAIKEQTGWDVKVAGNGLDGCYHFYTDHSSELDSAYDTSVYVCKLNHLTVEQWVDEFKSIIKDIK